MFLKNKFNQLTFDQDGTIKFYNINYLNQWLERIFFGENLINIIVRCIFMVKN